MMDEGNVKTFISVHKEAENQKKAGSLISSHTVRGMVMALKVFLKYLYEEGYVSVNIAPKIKSPKVQKKIIQTLSHEQIENLLKAPEKTTFTGYRDYCMLLAFIETGMRLSELINLKVRGVDFTSNILTVIGKGNKERRIPFGVSLKKALEKYIRWRKEVPGQDALFLNQFGDRMKSRRIGRIIEYYGERAGITGVRMSPHTLRHTFAKMSLLNGLDVITLQYIMGHESLEMVRNYVDLTNQDAALYKNRFSILDTMEIKGVTRKQKLF